MWFLLLLMFGGLVLATLAWTAISSWFTGHTTPATTFGELVKTHLANGNYRVVAGVFGSKGTKVAHQIWDARELDAETSARFGKLDTIRVQVGPR